jgi:hypothetical protein
VADRAHHRGLRGPPPPLLLLLPLPVSLLYTHSLPLPPSPYCCPYPWDYCRRGGRRHCVGEALDCPKRKPRRARAEGREVRRAELHGRGGGRGGAPGLRRGPSPARRLHGAPPARPSTRSLPARSHSSLNASPREDSRDPRTDSRLGSRESQFHGGSSLRGALSETFSLSFPERRLLSFRPRPGGCNALSARAGQVRRCGSDGVAAIDGGVAVVNASLVCENGDSGVLADGAGVPLCPRVCR